MKPSTAKDSTTSSNEKQVSKAYLNNELIEFVRLNPVLYDFKDPNYSSQSVKNSIWNKFAQKWNMELTDVKARWNILRTGYTMAKRRFENGLVKGKKWEYLDSMNYLNDFLKPLSDTLIITPKRSRVSKDHQEESNGFDENDSLPEAEQELYEDSDSILTNNEKNQIESNNNNKFMYDNLNQFINHYNTDELYKQYLEDLKNPTFLFLKSLLPSLAKYTDEQLNVVKFKLLGVIIEADKEFKKQ